MRKVLKLTAGGALLLVTGSLRAAINLGNVVCLGDSITEGKNDGNGGYRQFLQDDLTAMGYSFDFVGKEDNGQPGNTTGFSVGMSDPNHEGYGSFTINDTQFGSSQEGHSAPPVGTLLTNDATTNPNGSTDPVNLVLLMIGTNNMGIEGSSYDSNAPSELNQLVNTILNAVPNVSVIVGSIPPLDSSVTMARAQAYNSAIANTVAAYQSQGDNVRFADTYSAMNLSQLDPADDIHPLPSGYQNIAQAWAQAIGQTNINVSNSSVTIASGTTWAAGTLFVNNGGTTTFQSDSGSANQANLSITVPTGSVIFQSTQHLTALTIGCQSSAGVTSTSGGNRSILTAGSLIVSGTLDLTNNELDVQNGNLPAITAWVENGFAGSTSSSIISSTIASDTTHLTTLGVIANGTNVLVAYAYYGDANLDGKVDGSDYSLIDNGYLTHTTGWYNGDFNYNGAVNGSDYTLIDNAFNRQGTQFTALLDASSAVITSQIISAVPEPGGLTVLGVTTINLLARRRRFACHTTQAGV
jgi:lysophospholipase L1-like esterase